MSRALLLIALVGLLAGLALMALGQAQQATLVWTLGVVPVLAGLLVEIVQGLRRREVGLDILAALSMGAALTLGEELAAAVVALMYTGGTMLEAFAEGRARREMRSLLARVPRTATRHDGAGGLQDVALDALVPGDRLLIRRGDVVPVDGRVAQGIAVLDTSALTGESLPVRCVPGDDVLSGATNAGEAFDLTAMREASGSTLAGIVRLVDEAQRAKAPMARLADRWSLGFLAVSVSLALLAWWASGDPVRAVAVLVVATPCPLILAVPVAWVAGLSRAARFGVLVKGARPLEAMARIRTLVLDKTGTLTEGRPALIRTEVHGTHSAEAVLRLAAALDQASRHPVAEALVAEASARGHALPVPQEVVEQAGEGLTGLVAGHRVALGGEAFVCALAGSAPQATAFPGELSVAVAIDGQRAGRLVMRDPLRAGVRGMLARLRALGVQRMVLATGDRLEVARAVAGDLGLDALRADLAPDQKVLLVLTEHRNGPVMMVGDGVNDAPALAAADVGVAMGARGAAASAEAADVVLLVDRLDRIADGIAIARGARAIALQSVAAGVGLSVLGMIAAALGWLTPVQGAVLQEVIDVAVILNALRVLRIEPDRVSA